MAKQISQEGQGIRMEAKFRLVKEHGWRWIGLQESRRETDEAQCAVGKLICPKRVAGIALAPLKMNQLFVSRHWAEEKIIEERRGQPHSIANSEVVRGIGFADAVKKCSEIFGVGPKFDVVIEGMRTPYSSAEACVVKMVNGPVG